MEAIGRAAPGFARAGRGAAFFLFFQKKSERTREKKP